MPDSPTYEQAQALCAAYLADRFEPRTRERIALERRVAAAVRCHGPVMVGAVRVRWSDDQGWFVVTDTAREPRPVTRYQPHAHTVYREAGAMMTIGGGARRKWSNYTSC